LSNLLITDVVMPKLGGTALAERLRAAQPTLKVLFLSGYATDEDIQERILRDEFRFLQKPFTPRALARKVREALDR
jgi:DNA-binding NtrC family response regulator